MCMPDWKVVMLDLLLIVIFHALDWTERNAISSSIHFANRKQF